MRIFTSAEDEQLVQDLWRAFGGRDDESGPVFKWHILRLALTFSLRLPVPVGEEPRDLETSLDVSSPGGKRGEYRLQQVTGEGAASRNLCPRSEDAIG